MPSPFDAIDAAMQATVDALFGEGIRVIPQAGDPNYAAGDDPDRPARAGVRATVAIAAKIATTDYSGSMRNGAPVASAPSELWIDRIAYAALGYALKRGDFVEITELPGQPVYKIAAVRPFDSGDVQIILG